MSKTIYKDPTKRFYVYAFLREDDTPYYIGKGTGARAWVKRRYRPDDSRILILFENLTETEAFSEEIRLIQFHGRKDLGTGILRNLTDGGEGASGYKHNQDALDKMSTAKSGEKHPRYGKTGEKSPMYGKTGEKSPRYGKKHTQDARDKLSAAMSGEKHHMYGKHHTQDARDTMSAAMSGENHPMYGKVPSEDTKAKRLATRKRNKEAKVLLETIFTK